MKLPHIKVKKLHKDAVVPTPGSEHAAGLDLHSIETVVVEPGERKMVGTGLAMAIHAGYVGLIWPRSKLANKHGIMIMAGVIDADYRGEVKVLVFNSGTEAVELLKGEAVAQMVLQQTLSWIPVELTDDLDRTDRGAEGIDSMEMRRRNLQ